MYALCAIAGGAITALSGLVVQAVVLPSTTVPDTQWSYPWSPDVFVPITLLYAVFHGLVMVGVVGYARSGAAGTNRVGPALAVAGTAALFVAELASLPFRADPIDAAGPAAVGTLFGLGTLLTGIGFLVAGLATVRAGVWHDWRRYVPLATGIWSTLLVGIAFTPALAAGVGVYGLGILALGLALRTPAPATRARVAA